MRSLIAAVGIAIAALTGALGLAPTASATVDGYIYDLEHSPYATFTGSKSQYVSLGHAICADFYSGFSPAYVIDEVWRNPNFSLDYGAARIVVQAAADNLC